MKNVIRLTESDLVDIVKNIVSEQTTGKYFKVPDGGTAKITNKYAAGYYSMNHTDKYGNTFDNTTQFKPIMDEAITFLKTNKGYIPKVVLVAGESIIPNADVEGGTGTKKVGWLSNARKTRIDAYIKKQLKPLLDEQLISRIPDVVLDFQEAKTLKEPSGGWSDYRRWRSLPPEKQSTDPKNDEYISLKKGYDDDQMSVVKFSIIPDIGPNQCTFNVQIGVHYDNLTIGHECNFARYEITANGVVLTTTYATVGAGKPYADMNNGGGSQDAMGMKSIGGVRQNYFKLKDKKLIDTILSKSPSPNKDTMVIRARCLTPGFRGGNGCHTDAPHVTVHDTDGIKTVDGYPKTNDGELITLDKCGKSLSGPLNTTPTKSADSKGAKTTTGSGEPTPTGKKYTFQADEVGTLTSDQSIQSKLSNGFIKKNADGTYLVLKPFTSNKVNYQPGDQINKVVKSKKEL